MIKTSRASLAVSYLTLILLSACTTFEENTRKLGYGQSPTYVKEVLGEPDQELNKDGVYSFIYNRTYDNQSFPYFCQFEDSILVRWGHHPSQRQAVEQAIHRQSIRTQAVGQGLQQLGEHIGRPSQPASPLQNQCTGIEVKPIASPGCSYVCINRQWSEVCH